MDQLTSDQVFWAVTGTLAVLVFGGFGSYVANEKHRHWAEGFIFGAMMGPLGVIAAACLPTLLPRAETDPDDPGPLSRAVQEREERELNVAELAERLRRAPISSKHDRERWTPWAGFWA
jgi:hypothetical protein